MNPSAVIASDSEPTRDAATKTKLFLIIEDDAMLRENLVELLEFSGFQTSIAANG